MSTMKLTSPPVIHYDLEARLWMFSIRGTRYLHLTLNIISVVFAFLNYISDSDGERTEAAEYQKSGSILFLAINLILVIASLTLITWHCTICCRGTQYTTLLKPIYEVIYYVVGSLSLGVATLVLLFSHRILHEEKPENFKGICTTAVLAGFNAWMCMRNAFRLYILSTPI